MDKQIEELKRLYKADPNHERRLQITLAEARVKGSEVYLDLLNDRLLWNSTMPSIQDLAIQEVGERLGKAYAWRETQVYSCGGQAHRIAKFEHLKTGIALNLIPGGRFMMGGQFLKKNGGERWGYEQPSHEACVSGPLLVGCYPVTQKNWDSVSHFMNYREEHHPDLPVDHLAYNDVDTWLWETSDGLLLPTEIEWEYACRAGTQSEWFFGDDPSEMGKYAWYLDNSLEHMHPVGQKKPNAFGLYDMLGNVEEWCSDIWSDEYSENMTYDPDVDGEFYVCRGGNSYSPDVFCSSDWRISNPNYERFSDIGFRVVCHIPEGPELFYQ